MRRILQVPVVLGHLPSVMRILGKINKIYVSHIPENVSTLENLKIKLNNTNILHFKRVGIKETKPRKLIITMYINYKRKG